MTDELPEINVTRGEKALATVLVAFLLIGGLWMYFTALPRDAPDAPGPVATAEQRRAIDAGEAAERRVSRARSAEAARERTYEEAREDYRTDLDADTPTTRSRPAFLAARRRLTAARDELAQATADRNRVAPPAQQARREIDRAQLAAEARYESAVDRAQRNTALLRLAWVLLALALAFWLFNTLRRRRSNYFVAGVAAIIAATLQALVMAFDYLGDEIDFDELGPLVIALAGIAFTLLALVALERYLVRRAPRRRVRKGQCPFCAYPVTGRHCEGCGRATLAPCTTCEADRRVGTRHCATCGAS
jgi:hypothetical protein